MTASTPPRSSSTESQPATAQANTTAKSPTKLASKPLERARAAARKLLGRDRDKQKKDDPNIYPLF